MRISSLELTNYKCFSSLRLEGLGARVILVGPNGSGKSTVLEAVAVLKEFAGSYNAAARPYGANLPVEGYAEHVWPDGIAVPVRAGAGEARVTATFALTPGEVVLCGGGAATATVGVVIRRSRKVELTGDHARLTPLFRNYTPSPDIGVLDYIGPSRSIPHTRATTLNPAVLGPDQQRLERVELPRPSGDSEKLRNTKQYLLAQDFADFAEARAGRGGNSLQPLRDAFHQFFAPKSLIGTAIVDGELQYHVRTPFGDHDVDALSSGEKELLGVLVNLFRIREYPSVVLYDEPERHLNAGLESKLIPALDALNTRNQVWIATHGVGLVASAPLAELVALRIGEGEAQPVPERVGDEATAERVRLLERLGADVGLQLASKRVVFVEGEDATADARVIRRLVGHRLPGTVLVPAGGAGAVLGGGAGAGALFSAAGLDAGVRMVLDRDYHTDEEVAHLTRGRAGRVFVWPCHEVENLLLVPEALLAAVHACGESRLATPEQVRDALHACARERRDLFVAQRAAYRLTQAAGDGQDRRRGGTPKPRDRAGYLQLAAGERTFQTTATAEGRVEATWEEAAQAVDESLADGTWIERLPGKELLAALRRRELPTAKDDLFKNVVLNELVRGGAVPPACDALVAFVLGPTGR